MPKYNLNRAKVGSGIKHVSRTGVSKQVPMDAELNAGPLTGFEA